MNLYTSAFTSVTQDNGFSFTLEAVKILKQMMKGLENENTDLTASASVPVCVNPDLPEEFLEVCQQDDHDRIFANLGNCAPLTKI